MWDERMQVNIWLADCLKAVVLDGSGGFMLVCGRFCSLPGDGYDVL
jgi:hypothetical protein